MRRTDFFLDEIEGRIPTKLILHSLHANKAACFDANELESFCIRVITTRKTSRGPAVFFINQIIKPNVLHLSDSLRLFARQLSGHAAANLAALAGCCTGGGNQPSLPAP